MELWIRSQDRERLIKQCIYDSCTDLKEINKLISYFENLQKENELLKTQIDKAIEYIEKGSAFLNDDEYEVFNKKELLEILKGKSE